MMITRNASSASLNERLWPRDELSGQDPGHVHPEPEDQARWRSSGIRQAITPQYSNFCL